MDKLLQILDNNLRKLHEFENTNFIIEYDNIFIEKIKNYHNVLQSLTYFGNEKVKNIIKKFDELISLCEHTHMIKMKYYKKTDILDPIQNFMNKHTLLELSQPILSIEIYNYLQNLFNDGDIEDIENIFKFLDMLYYKISYPDKDIIITILKDYLEYLKYGNPNIEIKMEILTSDDTFIQSLPSEYIPTIEEMFASRNEHLEHLAKNRNLRYIAREL